MPDNAFHEDGADEPNIVDYRFTLAAERTFLAWIRTALALLAGGVAVLELVRHFGTPWTRTCMSIACIALGALMAAGGYQRWRRVDAAIRADRPLPRSPLLPILAVSVVLISGVAAFAMAAS